MVSLQVYLELGLSVTDMAGQAGTEKLEIE